MNPITFAVKQGPRSYQEDRHFYQSIKFTNRDGWLIAVLDGHGGTRVAELCVREISNLFGVVEKNNPEDTLRHLVSQLHSLTAEFQEGSTLSVALVVDTPRQVSVAILGDSPVVVYDQQRKLHLSPEHNVRSNLAERKMAERHGGVYTGGYIYARDGEYGLQMSRALGDAYLDGILSREPDIYTIADPLWVLVASDGLFDPSHADTHRLLREIEDYAKRCASASELMEWAEGRGLHDNATAVVWDGQKLNPSLFPDGKGEGSTIKLRN